LHGGKSTWDFIDKMDTKRQAQTKKHGYLRKKRKSQTGESITGRLMIWSTRHGVLETTIDVGALDHKKSPDGCRKKRRKN